MRSLLYSLLALTGLHAQALDSTLLSKEKRESFKLDTKKVQAEAGKLAGSWINPINASYSGSFKEQFGYEQEQYNGLIQINQPIFKSGGIWFAINYAAATEHYNTLGVNIQKNGVIKEVISMMMQLRKLDLSIEKIVLQINDARVSFKDNQEQAMAGELDVALVNMQEIALNTLEITKLDLMNQKEGLVHQLALFSDVDYKTTKLPILTLLEPDTFVKKSIDIAQMQANSEKTGSYRNMIVAKYLPTFNVTASYNYAKAVNQAFAENFTVPDNESTFFNYGFSLSMMIDVNIFSDIQSAQVDHIKAKVELSQKQKEIKHYYEMVVRKVKNIDKKIELATKNQALYKKVLARTKQAFRAGDESKLGLQKSQNQLAIKAIDLKMFEWDKQIELLALYEKMHN